MPQQPQWGTPVPVKPSSSQQSAPASPDEPGGWGVPVPVASHAPSGNLKVEPASFLQRTALSVLGVPAGSIDETWTALKFGLGKMGTFAKENPAAAGAVVAGAITAPITAGMSLPAAAGFSGLMAAGGAGAGLTAADLAGNVTPPGDAAKQIAAQGVGGLAGEGVGRGIAWTAGKLGPKAANWLYNLGLRPTKAIRDQFPAPSGVAIAEGLMPNPASIQERLSGVEAELTALIGKADELPKTAGLLGPGTDTVDIPLGAAATGESAPMVSPQMPRPSMVDPRRTQGGGEFGPVYAGAGTGPRPQAGYGGPGAVRREVPHTSAPGVGAPPTMIDPRRIAAEAADYVVREGNLGARALKSEAREQLRELVAAYAKDNSAPMTVQQLIAQKRAEQSIASAAYMKLAKGGDINNIETLFHQGVAHSARKQLIERIPEAKALLDREQGLIGLKLAAELAKDRPETLHKWITAASVIGGMVSGHPQEGIIGAIVLHAIQAPSASAAIGIATNKLGQLGASQLTPLVMKGLAAAYGVPSEPVASHEVKR